MSVEHRIIGPPGTGKTYMLGRRVAATVRERGPEAIRIASLTRAAAAEIAGRVDLPGENVGTLHALAYRALADGDLQLAETPEGLRAWNDAAKGSPTLQMTVRSTDPTLDDAAGDALVPGTGGDDLRQRYAMLRARCVPRDAWPSVVGEFADRWETWKARADRLDFTDLIDVALRDIPTLPGGPSVFLVDEAQDLSRLEFMLARKWGEACDVFVVVGDPRQNLYSWRGSEADVFESVQLDGARLEVLERSRRVPAAVHGYAVDWLDAQHLGGLGASYLPRYNDPDEPASGVAAGVVRRPRTVDPQGCTWTSPEPLVRELEQQAADGRSCMVLASCGYMLEPLLAVLRKRGVPFHNPYRTKHGGWNPLRGAGRVLSLLRPDRDTWGPGARAWHWADVQRWLEPVKAQGVLERGSKTFLDAKCRPVNRFDLGEPGEAPADLAAIRGLFSDEADYAELASVGLSAGPARALDWYEAHLLEKRAPSLRYPLSVARRHGGEALRHDPLITVGTIHSVKGGEADAVYVFPDLSRSGFEGWLGVRGTDHHDAVARMFYVAFTRARDELVLCEPAGAWAVKFPTPQEAHA